MISEGHASGFGGSHLARTSRLTTYLEHHLTDPGLSAEELARVHHVSVRQLSKLWSANDLSLSQWIIGERLEGARHQLGCRHLARHAG